MSPKIVTLPVPARRQAAALIRRARLATGLSQEAAAQLCGVGVRTLRDWELGRVRMTQLEALCTLRGEMKDGGTDAAPWEKPRAAEYAASHQLSCSNSGAHSGLIVNAISVARVGAGTPALMTSARNSQYRDGEASAAEVAAASLIRSDTSVLPAARECGVKASHQAAAADDGDVVRLAAGNPKRAA